MLLLLPQRYVFSSKSQLVVLFLLFSLSCCCYHKGTYFQANHNAPADVLLPFQLLLLPQRYVFSSKSQRFFVISHKRAVVVATTKVRIFKQITTHFSIICPKGELLLLPQRYVFSSKSQLMLASFLGANRCCCYHKGTYFQANHNRERKIVCCRQVVVATTKVRIFKQITTAD